MQKRDWGARWSEGRIGFHQDTVTQYLAKYADQVWGHAPLGRVLVPLCGKTLDMVYLGERADVVVGVEYVEQAVKEFFAERELTPDIETAPHTRYHAGKYTLFAADFFEVGKRELGRIDAVFDRASLVALNAETRIRYANHLSSILPSGAKVLLVTFDYDQDAMDGPPFSVTPKEVERLFARNFSVSQLERQSILDERFRARGLTALNETVFELVRA